MATIPIRFCFVTGIRENLFSNVRLTGSWNDDGQYSNEWTTLPMREILGEDGCPAYEATVELDDAQTGWTFRWGVILDGPAGKDMWGVPTEVNDHQSTSRHRTFRVAPHASDQVQEERYYLNSSRRMGAQKHISNGRTGIRFTVWAPNAQRVELVMGKVFDREAPQQNAVQEPMPRNRICGGYIADDGTGMHNTWGPFEMSRDQDTEAAWDGTWVSDVEDVHLGDFEAYDHRPYMFRITKDDGQVVYRTDLYSRCQIGFGTHKPSGPYAGPTNELDGSVSCSVVVDPDRVTREFTEPNWPEQSWLTQDEFWQDEFNPEKPVPTRVEDLVIYELHVGALGFGHEGPGTLEDAMNFMDYLEELGVNAVELLPMSEYGGGAGGWGYATSHYFAIEYSGGGRDQYKWFVRECHRRGIAVIMDVVYNHYSHNANRAEWMYDTNSHEKNIYYWYEGHPDNYQRFNESVPEERRGTGGYLDNLSTAWAPRYHEEMVRQMFIGSAVALAVEFHVDGFRMDQTTSIHAYNVRHADGQPNRSANLFGQKLLRELTGTLKLIRPNIMLMAEDHSEWDKVVQPVDAGGLGFDATWYSNFYHHLVGDTDKGNDYAKLIKTAGFGDDRPLAMDYFAGALSSSGHQRVVYNESHDEAGNGRFTRRSMVTAVNGAPLHNGEGSEATRQYAQARCRFAAGMALLSAGTPMFLFGEEVGSTKEFVYGDVLRNREDLQYERFNSGRPMYEFYRDLIGLRRNSSALRSHEIDVVHVHNRNRVIAFRRWQDDDEFLVIGSLANRPYSNSYQIDNPRIPDGRWQEVFNSDSENYEGWNVGNGGGSNVSRDGAFKAVLPTSGFVVFQREPT